MLRSVLGLGIAFALLTFGATAAAQDDMGGDDMGGADLGGDDMGGGDDLGGDDALMPEEAATQEGAGTGRIGDEQAIVSERMGTEEARDSTDPWEDPQEGYYFAGLFYRHIFVPEFLLNLFLDESTGASNPAFGGEVTYRKDGFDIIGSIWYSSYAVDGAFRASGDPDGDTEIINSELGVLFVSASFLWSTPFNDIFALEYGVGLGLGVVLGDLVRTEAYPEDGGYAACTSVGNPVGGAYCDGPSVGDGEDGGHYGVEARKWSDGGDVPNVIPWLAVPQIALRIKPIKQLMMRIEGGFGIGFFLGGAINYGF